MKQTMLDINNRDRYHNETVKASSKVTDKIELK